MRIRAMMAAALAVTVLVALSTVLAGPVLAQTPAKLLLSQVEVRGSLTSTEFSEYVVIRNPGSTTVDLSDYYITDATFANGDQFYYNLPGSGPIGGGTFFDFTAKFPDGASLAPGEEVAVSMLGSTHFASVYGIDPAFELFEDGSSADNVPDMAPARPGSIVDNPAQLPGLTNSGEVVILFHWDGVSDLVTDIDYLVWGDKAEGVDKTGVSIDGPDADSNATAYKPDTSLDLQQAQQGDPTGTFLRVDFSEGTQKTSGSNGVGGRDETSENVTTTFTADTNGVPPGKQPVDTTPPSLASATGAAGGSQVEVTFSEMVGTGAGVAANYKVYPAGQPGSGIAVTAANAASGSGSLVTLTLASALATATSYTVEVSNVQDLAGNTIAAASKVSFTTGAGSSFAVVGAFQFGRDYVAVTFSQKVNTGQATQVANYSFTPALSVTSASVQDNGQTVILKTAASVPASTGYTVAVSGVTSQGGASLAGSANATFTSVAGTVVNIADIQNSSGTYEGQTVTVIGQVFIPVSSRGGTPSGYIQDGSGRGLNLFGGSAIPAVDDPGNVAAVTGLVELYFSTTEITGYTATLLKSDQPQLGPRILTVAQANSSQWEGTYIQSTGTVSAAPVASGSSNHNIEVADGGSNLTFRVGNGLGINFNSIQVGDVLTAAGAGGAFQSTFQINVGKAADIFEGSGGEDTTPPTLVSATGTAGETQVTVSFSEAVSAGASTASNYSVFPTGQSGNPIAVTDASASGATVTLNLASALGAATAYTVSVSNVQDVAGNTIASGSTVGFTTAAGEAFAVVGAFQFGKDYVAVTFSKRVNAAQATQSGNYAFTPALSIASVTMQENGQTAVLKTSGTVPASTSYSVSVSGVTSSTGESLAGTSASFTSSSGTVVNIAELQANPESFDMQSVTVIGQVYMPVSSRGGTPSGYIQDGSGRGLNVFGGSAQAAVNALGNVAEVSGTMELYFTTVEITGYTARLVASGQPNLAPKILTVAQASSSEWEGTYIQASGTLTSAFAASGSSNNQATMAGDGGGSLTIRIGNGTGVNFSSFQIGDEVTAAGAGAAFQSTFQILVGLKEDFTKSTGGTDTTPPTVTGVEGNAGDSRVRITFSEAVSGTEAGNTGNYKVYPAANPSAVIAVSRALVASNGRSVDLTLAGTLAQGTNYAVEISNVRDLAGNVIAGGTVATFVAEQGAPTKARLTIPAEGEARTVIKNLETIDIKIEGELDTKLVCRIFDLQGRLVKVLYDGRFSGSTSRVVTWDARDETFELVPAGMYICHLSTTDNNGRVTEDKAPIVVAVRLD